MFEKTDKGLPYGELIMIGSGSVKDNSRWIDYATEKPPNGSSVLVWLEEEHLACKYAVLTSMEIANGYLETINGIFLFDLDIKILAWCYLDSLIDELPLKYRNEE